MKSIVVSAIAVAICGLALAGASAQGDQKFDPAAILGNWTYVEGVKNGDKVDKDHLMGIVKIDKEKLVLPGEKGGKDFVMTYKLDPSKKPAALDMVIKDGPIEGAIGSKGTGIIAIEGDTLKICYGMDDNRPTKFESTKENKAHYFVLKKAK